MWKPHLGEKLRGGERGQMFLEGIGLFGRSTNDNEEIRDCPVPYRSLHRGRKGNPLEERPVEPEEEKTTA